MSLLAELLLWADTGWAQTHVLVISQDQAQGDRGCLLECLCNKPQEEEASVCRMPPSKSQKYMVPSARIVSAPGRHHWTSSSPTYYVHPSRETPEPWKEDRHRACP